MGTMSVTDGCPFVRVPVLSKIIVLILPASSNWSPALISMPFAAPFPVPTSKAAGVAIPSAHGHAMITAGTNARRGEVSPIPAAKYQNKPEAGAINMTDGTEDAESLSGRRCHRDFA